MPNKPLDTTYRGILAGHSQATGNRLCLGTGVEVEELRPASLLQIAGWNDFSRQINEGLQGTGLSLQNPPQMVATTADHSLFRTAPDRALLVSWKDSSLATELTRQIKPDQLVCLDLSHGRSILRLTGNRVRHLLSQTIALPTDECAFPPNHAAQTACHGIALLIHCLDPHQQNSATCFDIYLSRSFALSYLHLCQEVLG